MDEERWAIMTVLKFSTYGISSIGRLFNVKTQKFLHPNKGKNGYFYVSVVNDDGQSKKKSIHYFVASMFCLKDNREGLTVDHKNRDKEDNRADNLRWATNAEQAANKDTKSENKYGRPVCQYDPQGNFIQKWDKGTDAGKSLKINSGRISEACKNFTICANSQWRYFFELLPGEVWKLVPYPEYETLYASSYGRIMKENTGHITTGSIQNGYLHFSVYDIVNNKYVNRRMHRFVAAAFFGRHDNLVVNHKGGDTIHNWINNLEFTTQKQNTIHAVQTGLTNNLHKVLQYDRQGNYLVQYNSAAEASRLTGTKASHIGQVCKGERKTAGDCQWKYAEFVISNENILTVELENRRKVIQYDMNGFPVKQYDTIAQAVMENKIDSNHIIRACKGEQLTAGNYQWRYLDFTLSGSSNQPRKVFRYNLNDILVGQYDSLTQVSKQTGISLTCICNTCKGKQKTAGGCKWRYSDE